MPKPNLIITTILLAVAMGLALPAYNIYVLQPSLFKALTKDTEQDAIRKAVDRTSSGTSVCSMSIAGPVASAGSSVNQ